MASPGTADPRKPTDDSNSGNSVSLLPILIAGVSLLACVITGYLSHSSENRALELSFLLLQTIVVSIVIWQACDPFADAAHYIGHILKLPGSVRGATLDAIASSMPELFAGIFFVVLAVAGASADDVPVSDGEGFKSTIATCAGSAVYNMILIPAICAIFISFYRKERPTIDVESSVITRDGAWFVAMEILLIGFLVQNRIHWWMGVVFLLSYLVYVIILYLDARRFQARMKLVEEAMESGITASEAMEEVRQRGITLSRDQERRFDGEHSDEDDDEEPETAGVLFGLFEVRLSLYSAWTIILFSTLVAAAACYQLVRLTEATAETLGVDIFFVAVILAAAASSVPDTFLSIGSARKGDDDGAVSNAFGSNIFDISICVSIPLLVASYLNGWQPIEMGQSGDIVGLQIMLAVLTLVTLGTIWHKRQLTRGKAFFLCGMYAVFIAYAVLGSWGVFGSGN